MSRVDSAQRGTARLTAGVMRLGAMVCVAASLLCTNPGAIRTARAQASGAPALPQRTMQWQALAARIVQQLQLEPGERVISIAQPGMFAELVPLLRYEVMKAGGVDLGVIEVLDDPYPAEWSAATLAQGLAASKAEYVKMLKDVDAAIMLPGANPVHPAYSALQSLLFEARGPRRTIHFHWTDPYSSSGNEFGLTGITLQPGFPPPPMQVIDRVYQRAVLETDLAAMARHQASFAAALRGAQLIRVTTPAGTDLRFRVGDRAIIEQNGDASARRMRADAPFLVREVEIPGGALRVAPLEDSVEGVVVYPWSAWDGHSVEDARITYKAGRIVRTAARRGAEHLAAELAAAPEEARRFREFGLGFNPLLAPAETPGWVAYYGYGAGVLRLGIGNNRELGGEVRGRYFRWRDLLLDATVSVDGEVWLEGGRFVR